MVTMGKITISIIKYENLTIYPAYDKEKIKKINGFSGCEFSANASKILIRKATIIPEKNNFVCLSNILKQHIVVKNPLILLQ